ncbi:ferrous iron transport protein B [Candidatus Bipolaricaulota bacterium]|nr:ferrous iron transport protein B [Candidatus Bipolaricaulota bacterium]
MKENSSLKVALVGNTNVGKSVFFGRLTDTYTDVSNYPGTTVEVSRGEAEIDGRTVELIDTPGVNSLIPVSEDERITRDLLFLEKPDLVIQVADAKNLQRSLMLTAQLAEANLPTIVALNMADEADRKGIELDEKKLAKQLGTPVVSTVAPTGEGFEELEGLVFSAEVPRLEVDYGEPVTGSLKDISSSLKDLNLPEKASGLMILSGDDSLMKLLKERLKPDQLDELIGCREELREKSAEPVSFQVTRKRKKIVQGIAQEVKSESGEGRILSETLSRLTMRPLTGLPIFLIVLYGVYQFVGVLGAQVIVDFLEVEVFQKVINPAVRAFTVSVIDVAFLEDMLVGPYGLITMGLAWALALVLPVVLTFFLAFSILEDSGYIPRLSVMVDRLFRKIGLNGKAVLPMVLGLGCDTMATVTTRTLETKKERRIATLLLALGVPCSAQLGVILGLFAYASQLGLLIWGGVVALQLVLVGWLSSKLFSGRSSEFIMEIPPIRLPRPVNVARKTYTRVKWFLKEVLPFFLVGTFVVFLADKTGVLGFMIRGLKPLVSGLLDLPGDAAVAFILGFVRRDYGTAGLFEMARQARLSPLQITVSSVVITLFVPCIANYLMIIKERGIRTALAIVGFIIPYSISVGALLNFILRSLEVM